MKISTSGGLRCSWARKSVITTGMFLGICLSRAAGPAEQSPAVSALGRLEPAGGLVHVAAPYSLQGPSILTELFVHEGQTVTNSQVLAHTHTHAAMAAALRYSFRMVESARARLAQAETGVKPTELAALTAESQVAQADFEDARRELERQRGLRVEGSVSQQDFDLAQTRFLTRSNALEVAHQRQHAGIEVREVDVKVARAEVAVAEAQAERAGMENEQTVVRAPQDGQALTVHVRVGEEIGPSGVLDLGRTDMMDVRVEVYETDIRHLRDGQRVEVSGDAFSGTLMGRVQKMGRQVRPNRLLKPDPSAFTDSRVVEVIVRLDSNGTVSSLSGALVNARFLP